MATLVKIFIEHPWFQNGIIALIVANAVTLGLETSPQAMAAARSFLVAFDHLIIGVFVAELLLRLFVYRWSFFRGGWNIFDFVIVLLTMVPLFPNLSILRALRILRVLRLFSLVPQLRLVVRGFFNALPGLSSVMLVLALVFYMAAVLATKIFGRDFPEIFGSLPTSLFSLFQLMTLEGWTSEIVRPVMGVYPYAWAFFIPFIVLTTFAVLNMFIGIIVSSLERVHEEEERETREEMLSVSKRETETILRELQALRREVQRLKEE